VSYQSHTPAEWAQMVSLAVSAYGALSAPYFVFVDADLADFDPRPALARSESPLWQTAVNTGHDVNRAIGTGQRVVKHCAKKSAAAPREAGISLAALLLLLSGPEVTR
jgi:hypothetical protein